jgi:hypothetical protein
MGTAGPPGDEDGRALLRLLPADGSPADSAQARRMLGWNRQRWAGACRRLEEQGRVLSGQGRGETIRRDLTAVPPEFRPASGRPGAHVTIRQVPVTVRHAMCDLTGVSLSVPGRGGATVPARPGSAIGNSKGFQVRVDSRTRDVTITVTGPAGNA